MFEFKFRILHSGQNHRSGSASAVTPSPKQRSCQTAGEALAMVALPAKGKLKGVLYDIDGTLVNSDPLHYLA